VAAVTVWSGDIQVELSFPGSADVPPVMHQFNSVLRIVTQGRERYNLRAMFFIAVLLLGHLYRNGVGWFRVTSLSGDSAKTLMRVLFNCRSI